MKKQNLQKNEYADFYAGYILNCNDTDLIEQLNDNFKWSLQFFKTIPIDKYDYAYSEGKWTIKQLLQHIIDSERVFSYRALRFSREDDAELPGFDENHYVNVCKANKRSMTDLLNEYSWVRQSSIALFKSFDNNMMIQKGIASGSVMSVRALGFVMIGHVVHHCQIIRERYL